MDILGGLVRIKISCVCQKNIFVPYNYHYKLHSAIYHIIEKSSSEFSSFLHDTGFIDPESNKPMKLFTFSKIFFENARRTQNGFENVKNISFFFSTLVEKSLEHLVLGLFSDQILRLNFFGENYKFNITNVESMPEPTIKSEMKFICLSPIACSISKEINHRMTKHFLDYMNPDERERFVENIKNNLLRKYRIINKKDFAGNSEFDLSFDPQYIIKRNGRISKLISFKNGIKIKGMEAPFTINADPELIEIGFETGFGEKNSAGFGFVELIDEM